MKLLTNSALSIRVRNLLYACTSLDIRNSRVHWAYASGCLHPSELLCTLLSYAAPLSYAEYCWAIRCTLLSYPAPYWASLHPFFNYAGTSELHCTLWAMHHLNELRCALLSYAALYWAMLRSTELCSLFWAMPHLTELHCTSMSYAAQSWDTFPTA
jgi:hypothetical protein